MRWGVEVWDRFEDVSSYIHKGIEFYERYEEFWKKRCSIENSYAKSLRKLIESFEPKKKELDLEENNTTQLKCFFKMLSELRDVAGQHELVAENVQERIINKINVLIKSLKDERRRCIEDKDRYYAEHLAYDELLDKCKQKYERAYKEVEKAEELLNKVENDDSASKNDIKKQTAICDQKKRIFDNLEAEYGRQLCEANKVKNVYYYENLPTVFDTLQDLEIRRIENFRDIVCDCVKIESEILPRIQQCLDEINSSCKLIDSSQDTEVVVRLFKTGYQIPNDHVFEDLKQTQTNFNPNQELNGSLNSNGNPNTSADIGSISINNQQSSNYMSTNGITASSNNNSRQKKYRTLNRIKGLFIATSSSTMTGAGSSVSSSSSSTSSSSSSSTCSYMTNNELNLVYDLPPQQLINELNKKIKNLSLDIEKQQKEREGLMKLKDIYSKNQKFGDSQSAEIALKNNEDKLLNLDNQRKKLTEILSQVEIQYQQQYRNHINNHNQYNASNSEYHSSSSCSSTSTQKKTNVQTLPRDKLNKSQTHIYHSPGEEGTGMGSSLPATPLTHHQLNQNGNSISTPHSKLNSYNQNNTVAYAVSPVSQLNTNTSSTLNNNNQNTSSNNGSFDDDDDIDDDLDDDLDDEDEEDGCYESPNAALKHRKQMNKASNITAIGASITSTSVSNNGVTANSNTVGFIYADASQYDHVDNLTSQNTDQNEQNEATIGTALVMYSFEGTVQNAISIQENESLSVLERDSGDGWTLVKRLNGEKGYVPTDYIRIVYY